MYLFHCIVLLYLQETHYADFFYLLLHWQLSFRNEEKAHFQLELIQTRVTRLV